MKKILWVACTALLLLFLSGCDRQSEKEKERAFSLLVPMPVKGQSIVYLNKLATITSTLPDSTVSALVVNNPIPAGREALIAIAIENKSGTSIPLAWESIQFFHPKNVIRLLPMDQACHYFSQPNHSKPVLGLHLFESQMKKLGVVSDKMSDHRLLPTEKALQHVYNNIRQDICYVKLPRDRRLESGKTAVGFIVVLLPSEHFLHKTSFMLKIPVDGNLHKIRFTLVPIQ